METFFGQTATYLWTQSAQIAALCVLVSAACFALRKRTSHLRYLLWLLILAKCLAPSLITVSLAILPNEPKAAAVETMMPILIDVPPASHTNYIVAPASNLGSAEPSMIGRLSEIGPKTWFGMIWLAGLCMFTVVVLAKAARIHHSLKSRRRPVDEALQNETDEILAAVGKAPRLWLVAGTGQPFVWGLVRGSVYLPANFTRSTGRAHRRRILAHELAHVARFDALVNLLQTIAQAIFWFHPLVWIANRSIRAEREKCCDETAIARLAASPKDYSNAIVDTLITEYKSTLPTPSLAIAGPIRNIEDRIKTIMKPGKRFYKSPTLVVIAMVLLLGVAVVPTTIALTERADRKLHEAGDQFQAAMVGTWFFDNPAGDDEQMAIFPDGRVIVLYSNGHIDETKLADGMIELAEYGNAKVRMSAAEDDLVLQHFVNPETGGGYIKLWKRIDGKPKTKLLRPLSGKKEEEDERLQRQASLKRLRQVALAWFLHSDEKDNMTPGSLADLRPYIKDWSWVEANVVLVAEKQNFTEIRNPGRYPIAYDKSLLKRNCETTVAFADGHVEYCEIDRLEELGLVPDVVKRVKSMHKLRYAGVMFFVYADEHDNKLPAGLDELEPYDKSELLGWLKDNVDYFGEGTDLTNVKDTGKLAIAYDKKLLQAQGGTAVLFADGHVEFIKREEVEAGWTILSVSGKLSTGRANAKPNENRAIIEIETRFLFADKDFPEEVGMGHETVSGNGIILLKKEAGLKIEAIASSGPVDKPTRVKVPVEVALVDDSQVKRLIKETQMRRNSSTLTAPKIMVWEDEEAEIEIVREIPFIAGYKDGHSVTTAGKPVEIHDMIEVGTTLSVTPRITEDGKYCLLKLEAMLSKLSGYDRRRHRNKYSYDVPQMEVLELKSMRCVVPAGKTLLLFAPWDSDDDKKGLIMLVKPTIAEAKVN